MIMRVRVLLPISDKRESFFMAKEKAIAEIKNGAVYILQAGTPVYVKTADFCSIMGKSNQWAGQLTSQGTLNKKKTPYGSMYELKPNMQAYCDWLENRKSNNKDEKTEQKKIQAEVKLKTAKAAIASIQAQELLGKMHRAEDVIAVTQDMIYAIRGELSALPGRVAIDVAAVDDPAMVSEIIRKEVYKIMEELAGYQYDVSKYEERVRERMRMEAVLDDDDEDEQ